MVKKKAALREYRKSRNLSAQDMAEKMGVAASTFRSWENGNREMSAEFAVQCERLFGISRDALRPDLFRA